MESKGFRLCRRACRGIRSQTGERGSITFGDVGGTTLSPAASPSLGTSPRASSLPSTGSVRAPREIGRQPACKPGSVGPGFQSPGRGGHSSGIGRRQPPRATNPDDKPGNGAGGRSACPPLFGLAPGGVYRAAPLPRRGALLPHPFTLTRPKPRAVCFLWHFPWGRPRRTLSGTVLPWSPDFLPRH